jgi:3alpha(or 20beta)-hydroxysteroid dehydrogenase
VSDRLAGKRILITGASGGLGAALARGCVAEGARVVLSDVSDAAGEALADELVMPYVHLDIADAVQWASAMDFAHAYLGGLDGLVNNAAILHMGPIETTSPETMRRVFDVNIAGTYLGIQAAIAPLRAAGGGSIVNIGSIDAMAGMNAIAAYSASKWAIRGLTRSAAIELGRDNIRVNAVHPSLANPAMSAPWAGEIDGPRYMRHVPPPKLYRNGEPVAVTCEHSVPIVVHLLADESAASTGGDYMVDAGWTAGPLCPGLPGF